MLAAPAATQAATYTVSAGGGACGGGDLACGNMSDAAAAAATGDVFNVSPGTYDSATFAAGGITIAGTAPGAVIDGALVFSAASGGVSKFKAMVVSPQVGNGPGISVTGPAGLEISDAIVLSPAGDGVQFHEGSANKIVRSTIGTAGQVTAAVHVFSADASTSAKALTMESTLASGGAAAIKVETGTSGIIGSTAGDATLTLRHVTAAGSTNGLVLDSTKAAGALLAPGVGNIVANVTDSIVQNQTVSTSYPGLLTLLNKNTITETYTRTLRDFDAAAVFVDPARRKFRLKAGSPAINAGGFTPGESTTDFEGQDRSAPPTDQGADEYVAPPPAPPGPPPPGASNDGTPPAIVITKPKANAKIKINTVTTKTTTVTKNGKKVKVKKKTTKKTKIGFAGTSSDAAGVKAVALTVEKLSSTTSTGTAAKASQTPAPAAKCKWLNATKGIVSKTCAKPVLLLAKLAKDGSWTYNLKTTLKLGAGTYRIIVFGLDNSGAFGNSAPSKDSVHRFTLLK
jgi:mRNA-degrading endonuclease toxin of MazEF toxin-antitoxin module